MSIMKISDNQEAFCKAYAKDERKIQAYKKSFNCEGLTSDLIFFKANEVSKNPIVVKRLKELFGNYQQTREIGNVKNIDR